MNIPHDPAAGGGQPPAPPGQPGGARPPGAPPGQVPAQPGANAGGAQAQAAFDPTEIVDDGVITSPFQPPHRPDHMGVDIDTPDDGDNVEVHTPVAGTVEFVGGDYGTVSVRDAHGYLHQFLHLERADVDVGDRLQPGDTVGIMGGRGPEGPDQYEDHVHYQVRDPEGDRINPETDYPFFGEDAVDAGGGEGPGDPPGEEGGPGSYGGEDHSEVRPPRPAPGDGPVPDGGAVPGGGPAPGGGAVPGGGPVPDGGAVPGGGPAPGGGAVPGGGPAPGGGAAGPGPDPAPLLCRETREAQGDRAGAFLLASEAARLARLAAGAASLPATETSTFSRRAELLAAARRLERRMDLLALTAREAAGLGRELLERQAAAKEGRGRGGDSAPALRLAAYVGRAIAYELAAGVLGDSARRLVDHPADQRAGDFRGGGRSDQAS